MHKFNRSQTIFPQKNLVIIFLPAMALLIVLGLALTQQAQAGFDCSGNSWNVASESDLNSAIACYNSQTVADDYTTTFTQNISLTTSTTPISNTVSNVALIIEGAGFTIDGQEVEGIRPYTINPTTTVTIQNSTITNGKTPTSGTLVSKSGGGIYNSGTLTLTNSTLSNNSADYGGGIYNEGTLTIAMSTLNDNSASNHGGGIHNSGTLTISNSTLNKNAASRNGGGIHTWGTLTMSNSTVSGNSANNYGGGLHNEKTLTVINSTIYNNRTVASNGGGVASFDDPLTPVSTTLSNNIVSGNIISGTTTGIDVVIFSGDADTFISNGYNLIGNIGANITAFNQPGDQINMTDPKLGPLQNNGGNTFTHALLPGSPAINTGNTNLSTDQRGIARPQGSVDDIGAFELQFQYSTFLPVIQNP